MKKKRTFLVEKICLVFLMSFFFIGAASANTVIDYTLSDGWTYESKYPATLSLSNHPSGGITANINVGSGIVDGGLTASIHDLPGFSIFNDGFIQLEYGSLTRTISGSASSSLNLELEFYDSSDTRNQIGISLWMYNGLLGFGTWFENDLGLDLSLGEPVPIGLSAEEGALGLYFHDSSVSPYFKDIDSNVIYPLADWDLSAISAMSLPSVDNDFEAETIGGGTVMGSVNLQRIVYGSGAPAPPVPIPGAIWLLGSGLVGLVGIRRKFKK
ncbi:MAG: VPLPA-CTERM sorting domain-containing protein [Proteobacteria bacterium]|nr:VPLPA-CTERM sorting domain-containing protein [Pseudomonadota bacterium]